MKWNWSSMFGGGSLDTSDEPMWRTFAPTTPANRDCRVETRMVTTDSGSRVEIITNSDYGEVIVTFQNKAGVDNLIGQLIKMRDLLELMERPPS